MVGGWCVWGGLSQTVHKEKLNLFKDGEWGIPKGKGQPAPSQGLINSMMAAPRRETCPLWVGGLSWWACNTDGMQVCGQVPPGQFQFLVYSDSCFPWSFLLFFCSGKLTNAC